MEFKTTWAEIWDKRPCSDSWRYAVNGKLGYKFPEGLRLPEMRISKGDMDKEISILDILNFNGVKDAYWSLCTQEYKDICLILADVAESVLWIFEKWNPDDTRPRGLIQAIRQWHDGQISWSQLRAAAYAADAAADAYAANTGVYAAGTAAVASAAYAANAAVYASSARRKQWAKNEAILRKYLES